MLSRKECLRVGEKQGLPKWLAYGPGTIAENSPMAGRSDPSISPAFKFLSLTYNYSLAINLAHAFQLSSYVYAQSLNMEITKSMLLRSIELISPAVKIAQLRRVSHARFAK